MKTHIALTVAYRMRKALTVALVLLCAYVLVACQSDATPTTAMPTTAMPTTAMPTTAMPTSTVAATPTITLPPTTLEVRCAYAVAKAMGIHYTYEDGATERMDEFASRTYQCTHDGALPPTSTTSTIAPVPTPSPRPINEDEPGWDCHTMGNRICGPNA